VSRIGVRAGAAGWLACVSVMVVAAPALGCSGPVPTFSEAVAGAEGIARVIVTDVTEYGEPAAGETFRVVRVLKGALPSSIQLDDPRSHGCGDTIGYYVREGGEAIVAFAVPFHGSVVHPFWMETGHPVEPIYAMVWETPEEARTLDDVERLILAALPDTAIPVEVSMDPALIGGLVLLGAAMGVAAGRLGRRLGRR
jgi:hypothetical protein